MSRALMPSMRVCACLVLLTGAGAPAGGAEPAGHGGPIRALAALSGRVVSGGFDGTAIVWPEGRVLRGHDGAVTAVGVLADGRVATGGADGRVILASQAGPAVELQGHTAPVSAIAVSGTRLATASWDGTVRIWAPDGSSRVLGDDLGQVNAVAWMPDGRSVVTAGYDGRVVVWAEDGSPHTLSPHALSLGALSAGPQNAVGAAPDGEIVTGGADGILRLLQPDASVRDLVIDTTPITALALSPDGRRIAVASLGGVAVVVDRATLAIRTVFLATDRPLWAVAWDGDTVVTGGGGQVVRRWDAATGVLLGLYGTPPKVAAGLAQGGGGAGAQVFRACAACHSLGAEDGRHAGPTLRGIFGRRIASVPGFAYSAALRGMDLVWTPQTVALLFEIGPHAVTPGTRMPEQRIAAAADRDALIRYLQDATRE